MSEEEVIEIVTNAVKQTESNPESIIKVKRAQMAQWLHKKFNIAIQEIVVNMNDGKPYLKVEYLSKDGLPEEAHIDMTEYEHKFGFKR